jgi:transcriptional regulator GlxA family with amidase domain
MTAASQALRILLLAPPHATGSTTYGLRDLFVSVGRDWDMVMTGKPGRPLFETFIVGRQAGAVQGGNGTVLHAELSMEESPQPDVVIVPEVLLPPRGFEANDFVEECEWLRSQYASGAVIASACSGAMLLAHAGLLDGLEATIHWAYADTLRRLFPNVTVREARTLVAAGPGQRIVTAGGGASWHDLGLYLIARFAGVEEAVRMSKIHLIEWHAQGQLPFAMLARGRQTEDSVIARCQEWLADNYAQPNPVSAMMSLSGLAERTFKRRFAQATGQSPIEYVHTLRIEEAKQMLERTDRVIEAIAEEVGYEDGSFFRRLFRRQVGLTPAEYRRRFATLPRANMLGTP